MFGERRSWRPRVVPFWLIPIALAACAIALLISQPRGAPVRSSIASLASLFNSKGRAVEPRLSGGVEWAPFRSRPLVMASAAAVSRNRGEADSDVDHTSGVGELLAGNHRRALSILEKAAEKSNDAAVWSDLAAAYHEAAVRFDAPQLLADALGAADRALFLDAQSQEALFNRALVIERLGLKDDAREAWTRYLAIDSTTAWAAEARTHLAALGPEPSFLDALDRSYERVGGNAAAAAALVAREPFDARGRGVMEVVGRWGQAVLRGDAVDAERHLRVARQLGGAVARYGGDRMLERAVATIDHADPATKVLLAKAHADYQLGMKTFQASRPVDAEPLLRRAALAFEHAGSPVSVPSRLFAANTAFEQGRRDEADRELTSLLSTIDKDFPAYEALTLRELGTHHVVRGEWGEAIALYEKSVSLFEQVRETDGVATVRRLLGFAHDRIGDPQSAWNHHVAALRGLGRRSSITLEKELRSIADAAILAREWQKAATFLSLHINVARRLDHRVQLASTLLTRAVVRDRLRDQSGAKADLDEARILTAQEKDAAYRAWLQVSELRASAMLSSTPPVAAEAFLDRAIEFQGSRNERLDVPGLLLQRARVRRAAGDPDGAMADVKLGIAELERQRESLPEGEARWGAFHAAEELFDEGIDLAMAANEVETAFAIAEQGRARALLDSYGHSPNVTHRRLAPGTTVVEYAALESRLVVFVEDADGVSAISVDCPRETLANEVDALTRAVRHDDALSVKSAAIAVYRHVIGPIANRLIGAKTIVFVPDATTSSTPFTALSDAQGALLLQEHAIVIAPGASAYAATAARRVGTAPRNALVIAAPTATDVGLLAAAEDEARTVAKAYANATRIDEDGAQFDELLARSSEFEVIHFAGHAVGDDRGLEPATITLRRNGKDDRITVDAIAKLKLRRTSIVVLAGCSTARGERRSAEGVISVAHGFLSAGASSVIGTLWPIDDGTAAVFFPRLHERLAAGMPAAEALRAAQLESIRRGDVPMSLWAAVQDIGN